MYYVLTSRQELLRHLPKGGIAAEIGVADGDYSAAILASAEPRELHLIDPWSHLETGADLLQASELLAEVDEARGRGAAFDPPPVNIGGDRQYAQVAARFEADP